MSLTLSPNQAFGEEWNPNPDPTPYAYAYAYA